MRRAGDNIDALSALQLSEARQRALAIPRYVSIMSHPVRHITAVLSCGHNVQVAWLIVRAWFVS